MSIIKRAYTFIFYFVITLTYSNYYRNAYKKFAKSQFRSRQDGQNHTEKTLAIRNAKSSESIEVAEVENVTCSRTITIADGFLIKKSLSRPLLFKSKRNYHTSLVYYAKNARKRYVNTRNIYSINDRAKSLYQKSLEEFKVTSKRSKKLAYKITQLQRTTVNDVPLISLDRKKIIENSVQRSKDLLIISPSQIVKPIANTRIYKLTQDVSQSKRKLLEEEQPKKPLKSKPKSHVYVIGKTMTEIMTLKPKKVKQNNISKSVSKTNILKEIVKEDILKVQTSSDLKLDESQTMWNNIDNIRRVKNLTNISQTTPNNVTQIRSATKIKDQFKIDNKHMRLVNRTIDIPVNISIKNVTKKPLVGKLKERFKISLAKQYDHKHKTSNTDKAPQDRISPEEPEPPFGKLKQEFKSKMMVSTVPEIELFGKKSENIREHPTCQITSGCFKTPQVLKKNSEQSSVEKMKEAIVKKNLSQEYESDAIIDVLAPQDVEKVVYHPKLVARQEGLNNPYPKRILCEETKTFDIGEQCIKDKYKNYFSVVSDTYIDLKSKDKADIVSKVRTAPIKSACDEMSTDNIHINEKAAENHLTQSSLQEKAKLAVQELSNFVRKLQAFKDRTAVNRQSDLIKMFQDRSQSAGRLQEMKSLDEINQDAWVKTQKAQSQRSQSENARKLKKEEELQIEVANENEDFQEYNDSREKENILRQKKYLENKFPWCEKQKQLSEELIIETQKIEDTKAQEKSHVELQIAVERQLEEQRRILHELRLKMTRKPLNRPPVTFDQIKKESTALEKMHVSPITPEINLESSDFQKVVAENKIQYTDNADDSTRSHHLKNLSILDTILTQYQLKNYKNDNLPFASSSKVTEQALHDVKTKKVKAVIINTINNIESPIINQENLKLEIISRSKIIKEKIKKNNIIKNIVKSNRTENKQTNWSNQDITEIQTKVNENYKTQDKNAPVISKRYSKEKNKLQNKTSDKCTFENDTELPAKEQNTQTSLQSSADIKKSKEIEYFINKQILQGNIQIDTKTKNIKDNVQNKSPCKLELNIMENQKAIPKKNNEASQNAHNTLAESSYIVVNQRGNVQYKEHYKLKSNNDEQKEHTNFRQKYPLARESKIGENNKEVESIDENKDLNVPTICGSILVKPVPVLKFERDKESIIKEKLPVVPKVTDQHCGESNETKNVVDLKLVYINNNLLLSPKPTFESTNISKDKSINEVNPELVQNVSKVNLNENGNGTMRLEKKGEKGLVFHHNKCLMSCATTVVKSEPLKQLVEDKNTKVVTNADENDYSVYFENKPRVPPIPRMPPSQKDKRDRPKNPKDMVLPPRSQNPHPKKKNEGISRRPQSAPTTETTSSSLHFSNAKSTSKNNLPKKDSMKMSTKHLPATHSYETPEKKIHIEKSYNTPPTEMKTRDCISNPPSSIKNKFSKSEAVVTNISISARDCLFKWPWATPCLDAAKKELRGKLASGAKNSDEVKLKNEFKNSIKVEKEINSKPIEYNGYVMKKKSDNRKVGGNEVIQRKQVPKPRYYNMQYKRSSDVEDTSKQTKYQFKKENSVAKISKKSQQQISWSKLKSINHSEKVNVVYKKEPVEKRQIQSNNKIEKLVLKTPNSASKPIESNKFMLDETQILPKMRVVIEILTPGVPKKKIDNKEETKNKIIKQNDILSDNKPNSIDPVCKKEAVSDVRKNDISIVNIEADHKMLYERLKCNQANQSIIEHKENLSEKTIAQVENCEKSFLKVDGNGEYKKPQLQPDDNTSRKSNLNIEYKNLQLLQTNFDNKNLPLPKDDVSENNFKIPHKPKPYFEKHISVENKLLKLPLQLSLEPKVCQKKSAHSSKNKYDTKINWNNNKYLFPKPVGSPTQVKIIQNDNSSLSVKNETNNKVNLDEEVLQKPQDASINIKLPQLPTENSKINNNTNLQMYPGSKSVMNIKYKTLEVPSNDIRMKLNVKLLRSSIISNSFKTMDLDQLGKKIKRFMVEKPHISEKAELTIPLKTDNNSLKLKNTVIPGPLQLTDNLQQLNDMISGSKSDISVNYKSMHSEKNDHIINKYSAEDIKSLNLVQEIKSPDNEHPADHRAKMEKSTEYAPTELSNEMIMQAAKLIRRKIPEEGSNQQLKAKKPSKMNKPSIINSKTRQFSTKGKSECNFLTEANPTTRSLKNINSNALAWDKNTLAFSTRTPEDTISLKGSSNRVSEKTNQSEDLGIYSKDPMEKVQCAKFLKQTKMRVGEINLAAKYISERQKKKEEIRTKREKKYEVYQKQGRLTPPSEGEAKFDVNQSSDISPSMDKVISSQMHSSVPPKEKLSEMPSTIKTPRLLPASAVESLCTQTFPNKHSMFKNNKDKLIYKEIIQEMKNDRVSKTNLQREIKHRQVLVDDQRKNNICKSLQKLYRKEQSQVPASLHTFDSFPIKRKSSHKQKKGIQTVKSKIIPTISKVSNIISKKNLQKEIEQKCSCLNMTLEQQTKSKNDNILSITITKNNIKSSRICSYSTTTIEHILSKENLQREIKYRCSKVHLTASLTSLKSLNKKVKILQKNRLQKKIDKHFLRISSLKNTLLPNRKLLEPLRKDILLGIPYQDSFKNLPNDCEDGFEKHVLPKKGQKIGLYKVEKDTDNENKMLWKEQSNENDVFKDLQILLRITPGKPRTLIDTKEKICISDKYEKKADIAECSATYLPDSLNTTESQIESKMTQQTHKHIAKDKTCHWKALRKAIRFVDKEDAKINMIPNKKKTKAMRISKDKAIKNKHQLRTIGRPNEKQIAFVSKNNIANPKTTCVRWSPCENLVLPTKNPMMQMSAKESLEMITSMLGKPVGDKIKKPSKLSQYSPGLIDKFKNSKTTFMTVKNSSSILLSPIPESLERKIGNTEETGKKFTEQELQFLILKFDLLKRMWQQFKLQEQQMSLSNFERVCKCYDEFIKDKERDTSAVLKCHKRKLRELHLKPNLKPCFDRIVKYYAFVMGETSSENKRKITNPIKSTDKYNRKNTRKMCTFQNQRVIGKYKIGRGYTTILNPLGKN